MRREVPHDGRLHPWPPLLQRGRRPSRSGSVGIPPPRSPEGVERPERERDVLLRGRARPRPDFARPIEEEAQGGPLQRLGVQHDVLREGR